MCTFAITLVHAGIVIVSGCSARPSGSTPPAEAGARSPVLAKDADGEGSRGLGVMAEDEEEPAAPAFCMAVSPPIPPELADGADDTDDNDGVEDDDDDADDDGEDDDDETNSIIERALR